MAGLKTFSVGEILTAGDVNTYLSQYVAMAKATPTPGTASVTFSGIPSTFENLLLIGHGTHDDISGGNAHRAVQARFNGDSGSNYAWVTTGRDAVPANHDATNASATTLQFGWIGASTSSFVLWIPRYAAGGAGKPAHGQGHSRTSAVGGPAAGFRSFYSGGVWASAGAAISSITLLIASENWGSDTTITLYGLDG